MNMNKYLKYGIGSFILILAGVLIFFFKGCTWRMPFLDTPFYAVRKALFLVELRIRGEVYDPLNIEHISRVSRPMEMPTIPNPNLPEYGFLELELLHCRAYYYRSSIPYFFQTLESWKIFIMPWSKANPDDVQSVEVQELIDQPPPGEVPGIPPEPL